MIDFTDYFDTAYDTGPTGFAAAVVLGETTFPGLLDSIDQDAFAAAAHTTHTLRYQSASATLTHNAIVQIDGASYKVVGVTHRINAQERRALLALLP